MHAKKKQAFIRRNKWWIPTIYVDLHLHMETYHVGFTQGQESILWGRFTHTQTQRERDMLWYGKTIKITFVDYDLTLNLYNQLVNKKDRLKIAE